jgi:hypothetical protein
MKSMLLSTRQASAILGSKVVNEKTLLHEALNAVHAPWLRISIWGSNGGFNIGNHETWGYHRLKN